MLGTQAITNWKPSAPMITGKAKPDSRDVAGDILRRHAQMEADRANWDQYWQDIATFVMPQISFTVKRENGFRQGMEIFDSTPELALDRFMAAMNSILTPAGQTWHLLKPYDEEVSDIEERRWVEYVNRKLFAMRYSPRSNFSSQIHEVYGSLGAFGTGAIFSEQIPGGPIIYRACNLAGLYIVQDVFGRVTYCHNKMEMTAEQAAQRFGVDKIPDIVKSKLETRPDDRATYIHCVRKNPNRIYGLPGQAGMAYESWWVCQEARQVVGKGGFRTFPYMVSRYVMRSGEVYGRSPAMMALADIEMLNEMGKVSIQEGQLSISPPLLAPHDGVLSALGDGIGLDPGYINWGGVDPATGRPLVLPLNRGSQWAPIKNEIDNRRKAINAAFLVTLFQILVDTPQMTATEAMLRAQEKGALLAPVAGRQQSELLGPLVDRDIDLMWRSGAIEPPPPSIMDRLESGEGYKLEYDSPLTREMKSGQGVGLLRTIEGMGPLATANPKALRRFNADKIAVGLSDINGVPADWLFSDQELAAQDAAEQQAVQTEQLVQALPAIGSTVKDFAQAQQAVTAARF
jgi:hypothetical protein